MNKIVAAFVLSLGFIFYVGSSSAHAATLTVTKIADTNDGVCNSDCSLREAIFAAASGDTIEFASPLFDSEQKIDLVPGALYVDKTLTISGRGASLTIISGNFGSFRRVFENDGNLTLNNLTVTGGRITGNAPGAGIYNNGTLTINNSVVSNNKNIVNPGTDNYVANKLGGGICNVAGRTLIINDSVITDNSVARASNAAGGGIYNAGTATITRSTLVGNTTSDTNFTGGGAIYNLGTLTVADSTLSGNAANGGGSGAAGGAIYNRKNVTLTNTTISGNTAGGSGFNAGGGIYMARVQPDNATLVIINTTITNNNFEGINAFNGEVHLLNSIVSGNGGTNLTGSLNFNSGNFINGNAQLAPLANNGGPTATHMLLPTSPAINAGNNCVLAANGCIGYALTTDQRGSGFPRLQGATVDIGAVESSRGIVLNANSSGAGSLRQILDDATAGDSIYFDPAFFASPRTITGNYGTDKNLTIVGPGANLLTLDAVNSGRVISVSSGATLNLSGVRLTRGRAFSPDSGAAVLIYENATLNGSGIIVDNSSAPGGLGGGIFADGTLNLTDSIVENNSANAVGGIFVQTGRTATLTRSIVRSNTATNNSGGIGNNGTLNFYDSTLSGNTAPFGGGMANGGFANFVNSTVSGNRVNGKGAGIYNGSGNTLHLLNTTITNNQADGFAAAGIWNENSAPATVRVRNTIIAGNISGNGSPVDYNGGIDNLGNNLINIANPGFAPLGNYGGATPTHALLANSPAINAGNNCAITANACGIAHAAYPNDQRGTNAPRKIGANVDIGAFERNISFDQSSLPNGTKSVAYNQTLTATRGTSLARNLFSIETIDLFKANSSLAPFTFSIIPIAGQSLPNGLTLAPDGTISGTPTAFGTFTFTVKGTDADGMAGAAQFTITIVNTPPTISGASVSRQSGSPLSNSTIANVGDAECGANSVSVAVTSANPSNGVTISNIVNTNGTVTANVSAACGATNATFTLRATDGDGAISTSTLTVNVSANTAPTLVYPSIASVGFNSSQIVAPTTANDNGTMTFSILSVSPALTTAPTVNSSGVVSITNAQPLGNHVITIRSTDNCGLTTDSSFTLTVTPPTRTITKIADTNDGVCDADCSLREAIAAASSGDTILFASPLFDTAQTIALGSELSVAGKTITISGRANNLTTLSGNNQNRIFNVANNGNLTLNDLTIANGFDATSGGGIYNLGTLQINNCAISGNSVSGGDNSLGGGIHNADFATATVTNSTLSGNSVSGVSGSNISSTSGGGIHNGTFSTLTITNSTISGNSASGVNNSSNRGGGIGNSNGILTVKNSTVSGNSATGGTNNRGGGIYSEYRTLNLIGVTITNNSAGGSIYSYGGGFFTVQDDVILANSIVSGNSSINNPNYFGSLNPSNHNLLDGDARLAPLGFYGGNTRTHALLPDSPALNAGNPVYTSGTHGATDQRASSRVIGDRIDIGAFESNIIFNQANLPNANPNVFYSQQFSANRLTSYTEQESLAPTVFDIVPVAGQSLPPGMTLSADGLLSGMPTAVGIYAFTVKATDTDGIAGAANYTIEVLAPTAATASVSGRVLTADDRGVMNALVVMTDSLGVERSVRTSAFGHYRFNNIPAGQIYIFTAASKGHQFAPQVINVTENLSALNFTSQ